MVVWIDLSIFFFIVIREINIVMIFVVVLVRVFICFEVVKIKLRMGKKFCYFCNGMKMIIIFYVFVI